MNLRNIGQKKWLPLALAFAIPFLGMILVMICSRYTPFGEYSMLYSDMYHQYFPFFASFRKALLSGDSLLYIWDMGMGMDHLGLISYYLASPLNLFSVLVPESWLLAYFSFLVPIKLGLASLFFAFFLKKIFHRNNLSIALFGSFYGLCAWALGYQWNIMWLDTFAVLPLVMVGMMALLQERKFLLYTFTLFFSIAANYYIGFFTCIFVLLVFICYEICRWESIGKFFADLAYMAVFSLLAIGMTAFLELPALAALQTTHSSVNHFPQGFRLNIAKSNTWKGLLDAMRQVAGNQNGALEPSFKEGLPNLYCGVIANFFGFLYLMSKRVKLRDKICSVCLLLFFNLSFVIRQLDYIWHGFHFTNMIPYRFSFLYSFVLLYMAYSAFLHRKAIPNWKVILAGMLSFSLILCSKDLKSVALWAYNLVFLLIYLGAMLYGQKVHPIRHADTRHPAAYLKANSQRKKIAAIVLCVTMFIEIGVNLVNFAIWFPGTMITFYPRGKEHTAQAIEYMKELERDTLFYRAETTHSQTLNDGALNDYHGISTFSSSANVKVTSFMNALGYGAKNNYNRYLFEESSPVANLFLGLKYMLERQGLVEENPYFDDVGTFEKVHLLKNNAYLPLGFLANSQLVNLEFAHHGDPFQFQNSLFRDATGLDTPVWNTVFGNSLSITSGDLILDVTDYNGHCSYSPSQDAGIINYMYTPEQSGFLCIYVDQQKRNDITIYKNGTKLFNESYSIPQMMAVSYVEPGDYIEVEFSCKANEKGTIAVQAAILNDEIFRQGYDILNASTWELNHMSNTRVEGMINCNRDGVLYTSIPNNGNWKITVDGTEAEPVLIGDVMLGVLLSQGNHQVIFHYENKAFNIGWKISLGCLLITAASAAWLYSKERRKHSEDLT